MKVQNQGPLQQFAVQPYLGYSAEARYLEPRTVDKILTALDTDRNGHYSPDEVAISQQLVNQLQINGNGILEPNEVKWGLSTHAISLNQFSPAAASAIASIVVGGGESVAEMGSLGASLDTDKNGFVTHGELTFALTNSTVIIGSDSLLLNPKRINQ